jgi:hypothetical protein
VERFFSTLKGELGERFDSKGDGKGAHFDYIEVLHNQKRRLSARLE